MNKMRECLIYRRRIINIINKLFLKTMDNITKQGPEEHEVHYDINEACHDYLFILNGIIYRWGKCTKLLIKILRNIKKNLNIMPIKNDNCFLSPDVLCNMLSYEFEDFIIAFPRLNEVQLIEELCRVMTKSNAKMLRGNMFSRSDINSLFWEINILRNRFAHSTPGYYTIRNTYASRFESFSSQIKIIEIKKGNIFLKTNLINLEKNEIIKNIIQKTIIEERDGGNVARKNIMDLLFPMQCPKGNGKNNPQVLHIQNIERFDLYNDFLDLSKKIFEYIEKQLLIILDEIIKHKK